MGIRPKKQIRQENVFKYHRKNSKQTKIKIACKVDALTVAPECKTSSEQIGVRHQTSEGLLECYS